MRARLSFISFDSSGAITHTLSEKDLNRFIYNWNPDGMFNKRHSHSLFGGTEVQHKLKKYEISPTSEYTILCTNLKVKLAGFNKAKAKSNNYA